MTAHPKTIEKSRLAVEALNIMKDNGINSMPVVEDQSPIRTINMQRIYVGITG